MGSTPTLADRLRARVSLHAVTRYVQRVRGVIVPLPSGAGPLETAQAHADAINDTVDGLRTAIMTPAVAAGLLSGARSVRTPRFVVVIDPGAQIVVTLYQARRAPTRLKTLSRSESRKLGQQSARRFQRNQAARRGAERDGQQ